METSTLSPAHLVQQYFKAYENKDQEQIERLLAEDFHFSSPIDIDDKIDLKTYMSRCWPTCKDIENYDLEHIIECDSQVIVKYRLKFKDGKTIRNVECFKTKNSQIYEVDVYFGRTLNM